MGLDTGDYQIVNCSGMDNINRISFQRIHLRRIHCISGLNEELLAEEFYSITGTYPPPHRPCELLFAWPSCIVSDVDLFMLECCCS